MYFSETSFYKERKPHRLLYSLFLRPQKREKKNQHNKTQHYMYFVFKRFKSMKIQVDTSTTNLLRQNSMLRYSS